MSEPLVGPDAAEIENPGPAFDGGEEAAGREPEPESAAEPEPQPDADADADAATLEAQLLAAAPEEAIEDSGLPDLTDDAIFEAALESVLLVVDSPIA